MMMRRTLSDMRRSIHATTPIDLIRKKGPLAVDAEEHPPVKSAVALS